MNVKRCECQHSKNTSVALPKVKPLGNPVEHGEGPYWSDDDRFLYFVSTFEPAIYRWSAQDHQVTSHKLSGNSVGFLVPVEGSRAKFILCHDRSVDVFSWNGRTNNSGHLEKQLLSVDYDNPRSQFNDGKADAKGRLWAGTLTRKEDLSVEPRGGALHLIVSNDNYGESHHKISSVSISNGLAWSRDNTNFFYIDSETRRIERYRFWLDRGDIQWLETLFDLKDHPHLEGIPDGMTIDADDNLWVALFGGKCVVQVDTVEGKLLRIVDIPATYVTSVVFGGENYDTLYVTTSKLKLSDEERQREPLAGSVFAVTNLKVRGWPANRFIL